MRDRLSLQQRQTAMFLRQRGRSGPKPQLSPVQEARVRMSIYLTWMAGEKDLDRLARKVGRSREWVKAFVEAGFPLM